MKLAHLKVALLMLSLSAPAFGQTLPRPSPKASVVQTVGLSDVTITYSRPGVKGRTIWGALVPYDKVWRTGANEPTVFEVTDDATINGEKLGKGKYSLHSIPGKDEWTVIFNSFIDPNGYSHDASKDALKIKVKPRSGSFQELLTFSVPRVSADSAEIVLQWEKLEVPFTVAFDTKTKTMAGIRKTIAEAEQWQLYMRAADYAMENNLAPEDAAKWLEKSLAIQENHRNLSLKARMLARKGDTRGAISAAEEAIRVGKASPDKVDTSATEKLLAEWKAGLKK